MIAPLRGITMTETASLTAGGLFHPSGKNQKNLYIITDLGRKVLSAEIKRLETMLSIGKQLMKG